jgi:hypothetical protein
MQAHIDEQPDVVVAFPTAGDRRRAARSIPDIFAPIGETGRRCTVVPLRRGHAAKKAGVLLKVRCLHAEIEALTTGLRGHRDEKWRGAKPPR